MTEWNPSEYARISALQAAMAEEVLSLLDLKGTERILDIGCGNGKTTAEIAARVPQGAVVGVDASAGMVAFAAAHSDPALHPNLQFAVADARHLPYQHEFDLVVSFNALHWIPEQAQALQSIRSAVKPDGRFSCAWSRKVSGKASKTPSKKPASPLAGSATSRPFTIHIST